MQMRIDHDIDFRRVQTKIAQPLVQKWSLDPVNLPELLTYFVAGARFHQDGLPSRAHQQTIHRHLDSVLRIARDFLFPEYLRHHAKHRAAIQKQLPVGDDVKFQFTELQRGSPSPARAMISFTAP